jgi:hypothetical protein
MVTNGTTPADPTQAWADAIALQCCLWLYPLHEMARMRAATATRRDGQGRFVDADPGSTRRWVNTFIHARRLLGAGGSKVVTPNNDTLYSNAWLDLSRGPVVVEVPDTAGRYYVLGFLDFWTNPFAHVGRRLNGTGAGTFLVTGPCWAGGLPEGMTRVAAATDHVWIIGRIMVEGPEDVAAVNALQDDFRMSPLAAWSRGERLAPDVLDTGLDPRAPRDAARFVAITGRALRENPPPADERVLLADAARLGLDGGLAGDLPRLPEEITHRAIGRALATIDALLELRGSDAEAAARGGWSMPMVLGESFGHDWHRRAVVARHFIGALASAEAFYPMAHADSAGRPLSGEHRYTIRFPPGGEPPVDCFWSLTMYDSRDCMLVPNPIERYRIGDRSRGLVRDADGGLTLTLQHASPGPALEPNWLPAPAGPFYLCLRAYQPRPELLEGRWRAPGIVRAG